MVTFCITYPATLLASGTAHELHEALTGTVVLFGVALVVAWLMRAVRLPTILGFLVAGTVIGPSVLDLIHREKVEFFAELGLVLLLFTIGLELSPAPLLRLGRRLLGACGLQIVATALLTAGVVLVVLPMSLTAALIVGAAVALSSTAIVLRHLSEQGTTNSPAGNIITGYLLLQDLAVIFLLIVLPLFNSVGESSWTILPLKIGAALVGLATVVLVAHLAMPVIVRTVFRFGGGEMMTLFAIVIACSGAFLASLADWSWPLGAFIAGLLLAQSDLRHQLRAEITPFRDAFNALFFMSIGMLVDVQILMQHPIALLSAIVLTLVIKTVLVTGSALVVRWPLRLALTVGLGLSTISEFSYVLVLEATRADLVPGDFLSPFVAWTVGTMLLGALFIPWAAPLATTLAAAFQPGKSTADADSSEEERAESHVIIVGFGINGRNLARVLHATGIQHVVVEMQPRTIRSARAGGHEVIVGDAARRAILEDAGLWRARALVVCIADPDATRRIVAQAHALRPDLYILARTRHVAELESLYRLGARQVVPEEFETSIEIFSHVLTEFGVPHNVVEQQITLVRAGHYGMLRGLATGTQMRSEWLHVLEAAVTQTFLVQPGSPAADRTIRDLDLRARTGATIVAITRSGEATASPPPEFRIQVNDVLVLVGSHRALDQMRTALDPPPDVTEA